MKHYFLYQKIIGLIFLAVGILAPIICDGDATVSVIYLPIGIYLIFTRKRCVVYPEGNQGENTQK